MPEPDPPKRPATYEDIEALPEGLIGEIIGGELYTSPHPAPPHILTASTLGMLLGSPFQIGQGGPGGWWILSEPELRLGRNVLVPDLAGWRKERLHLDAKTHVFEVAPDWVCEVISPSTRKVDRKLKPPVYLRGKVGHLWLIDPIDRMLEILRYGETGRLALQAPRGAALGRTTWSRL